MLRVVVCASVVFASFLVGCSGHDASVGDNGDKSGTSNQELQKKKDGSATGDGKTCSWEDTTTLDTCSSPKAPVPTYQLGDEFKSIDGCNVCDCTAKGIMCTVLKCGGGGDPGTIPPSPPAGNPPPEPPVACDASLRICKDGSPAKPYENTCKQVCPEDFGTGGGDPGGTVCPALARVCKDNIPAKQDPATCKDLCPEDFAGGGDGDGDPMPKK